MKKRSIPDIMLADACADNDLLLIHRCLEQGAGAGALGKRSGKSALAGVLSRQSEGALDALLSKKGEDWVRGWAEPVTPVVEAVKRGWVSGAGILMDAGFDGTGAALELTKTAGFQRDLEYLLLRYRPSQQELDRSVEVAAIQGSNSMVQRLLEHGASPDARAESGAPLALSALRENQLARAIYFARAKPSPLLSDSEGSLCQAWSFYVENPGELGELAREMVARGRSAMEAQELAAATAMSLSHKKGGGRI